MKKDYITDFMELYEIPKVKYQVEGRDVDEEGNIASWYEEEDYPSIEDVFFELLYLANWYDESTVDKIEVRLTSYSLISSLCEFFCGLYLEYVKDSRFEELEELKKNVQDVFTENVIKSEESVECVSSPIHNEEKKEQTSYNHIEDAFKLTSENKIYEILRNINDIYELSLEKLKLLIQEIVHLEILKHESLQHRYAAPFNSFMDCTLHRTYVDASLTPSELPNHEIRY